MNPSRDYLDRYISLIYETSRQGRGKLDERSLDVLERFIWEKYLSAYQIYSKLKTTPKKLAYKNINKKTNTLLSLGLIRKVADSANSKHNAIPYTLTEYGIYQLFVNRLSSIAPSGIEVEQPSSPPLNSVAFLRNYSDSAIFEIFLYPYFKKETLLAIGPAILWRLYSHLSTCCQSIESELKSDLIDSPLFLQIFSWNDVPGKDNKKLLSHLQKVFKLQSIDRYDIKKEDAGEYLTITVNIVSVPPIVIRFDKTKNKVLMMSRTSDDKFQELQYEVRHEDQEMYVTTRLRQKWWLMHVVIEGQKWIEQIIYEFVYRLASESTNEEYSYYCKILSLDDRFMKVVKQIYENRHKGFEKGYSNLMTS